MSVIDNNINKLHNLIDNEVLDKFYSGYSYILSKLDKDKTGRLLFNEHNLEYLSGEFNDDFDEVVNECGFLIEESLKSDKDIVQYLTKEYGLVFAAGSIALLENYQRVSTQDLLNILNSAKNTLKTQLMNDISLNNTYKKTLNVGIDKLKVMVGDYSKTYITTSKTILEQKILDITNKDVNEWEYVGPNDNVTRPQCLRGLSQQFFSSKEKEQFQAEGVRYNCRHIFVPRTKK